MWLLSILISFDIAFESFEQNPALWFIVDDTSAFDMCLYKVWRIFLCSCTRSHWIPLISAFSYGASFCRGTYAAMCSEIWIQSATCCTRYNLWWTPWYQLPLDLTEVCESQRFSRTKDVVHSCLIFYRIIPLHTLLSDILSDFISTHTNQGQATFAIMSISSTNASNEIKAKTTTSTD